jgi:prepilin peptidase CpaA
MNLLVTAPAWLIFILLLALAAAAVEDAWRLRISNLTCLAVFLLAGLAAALHGPSAGLWQNLAVFAALLVLGTLAFSAGALGGGDVKLLAALGLWVDLRGALWLLAAVFFAGGLLALLFIVARRALRLNSKRERRERRIPYGIAIVAGMLAFTAAQRAGSQPETARLPMIVETAR